MVLPANLAKPPAAGTAPIRAAILIHEQLSHPAIRSAMGFDSATAT
jgi:hypothetical protein